MPGVWPPRHQKPMKKAATWHDEECLIDGIAGRHGVATAGEDHDEGCQHENPGKDQQVVAPGGQSARQVCAVGEVAA